MQVESPSRAADDAAGSPPVTALSTFEEGLFIEIIVSIDILILDNMYSNNWYKYWYKKETESRYVLVAEVVVGEIHWLTTYNEILFKMLL